MQSNKSWTIQDQIKVFKNYTDNLIGDHGNHVELRIMEEHEEKKHEGLGHSIFTQKHNVKRIILNFVAGLLTNIQEHDEERLQEKFDPFQSIEKSRIVNNTRLVATREKFEVIDFKEKSQYEEWLGKEFDEDEKYNYKFNIVFEYPDKNKPPLLVKMLSKFNWFIQDVIDLWKKLANQKTEKYG